MPHGSIKHKKHSTNLVSVEMADKDEVVGISHNYPRGRNSGAQRVSSAASRGKGISPIKEVKDPTKDEKKRSNSTGSNDSESSVSSKSSQASVRSAVSTEASPRLRLTDTDKASSRKKHSEEVKKAFHNVDIPFLCNILGVEETIIEFCALRKTDVVVRMLQERPHLVVEPDVFIPLPGVLLNSYTKRSLSREEYMRAYSTYIAARHELEVSQVVSSGNNNDLQKIAVIRLPDAIREACRAGNEKSATTLLIRLFKEIPTFRESPQPVAFGKYETTSTIETYNRAHKAAMSATTGKSSSVCVVS
eukprot:NODE_3014_length_1441_cov_48.568285_g2617_i0.p1 GENE.NODE_3014_length_1441_cov_48.568285_g2617_i0~~NODE_3014_length_1441_cov_48.568285_g2617_i0.p1  ORF type:complete len:304 (+),score=41.21 NODE_3014_length_1441_cov_48.568285_g2617_i0:110-1021(+)